MEQDEKIGNEIRRELHIRKLLPVLFDDEHSEIVSLLLNIGDKMSLDYC